MSEEGTNSVIARAAKMADLPPALERAVIAGDLTYLGPDDRVKFYAAVCDSLGLNPLTKPFLYIELNRKLTLYASKDCTDQLRKIHGVSVTKIETRTDADVHVVIAYGCDKGGRTDVSTGAVPLGRLAGEARANAIMKAETKAKRRLTLSLCGLGMLDETEVGSIPDAKLVDPETLPAAVMMETMGPPPVMDPVDSEEPSSPASSPAPTPAPAPTSPPTSPPLSGWIALQARMTTWPPEIAAIIPPDEALYLMPEAEAEQNRAFYVDGIRGTAKRRKLNSKETGDLRELFLGSRTAHLDAANIYVLRALWRYMEPDRE